MQEVRGDDFQSLFTLHPHPLAPAQPYCLPAILPRATRTTKPIRQAASSAAERRARERSIAEPSPSSPFSITRMHPRTPSSSSNSPPPPPFVLRLHLPLFTSPSTCRPPLHSRAKKQESRATDLDTVTTGRRGEGRGGEREGLEKEENVSTISASSANLHFLPPTPSCSTRPPPLLLHCILRHPFPISIGSD